MTLLDILQVQESYRLPDKIMDALLSDHADKIIRTVKKAGIDIRDVFQTEQGDRENLKQDFTPDCVCSMVAKLMLPGNMLDMCSGTGALSKAAVIEHGNEINELEYSERTIPFALLDACVNGMQGTISRADCLRNIIFESYQLEKSGDISIPKQIPPVNVGCYNNIIMNPPYSMKFPDSEKFPILGFTIPKSKADYGFLLRGIERLNTAGRLIAILPHGVLFRGAAEGKIREYLVEQHMISAVIGLPEKLFLNTGIPVCLLILEQESRDILFIDASKDFEKKSSQNNMSPLQVQKVITAFEKRSNQERYAHVASYNEIAANDYNLNIPRYVDTSEPEILPDMDSLLEELSALEVEEQKVKAELYQMLGELTGSAEDRKLLKKHREVLKTDENQKQGTLFRQMKLEEYFESAM